MSIPTKTIEELTSEIIAKHGDIFDLSKISYHNTRTHILIGCKIHGFFKTLPLHLTRGTGCKKCSSELLSQKSQKTLSQFIIDAISKHGNKYDYSKFEYTGSHAFGQIICHIHGEFSQSPTKHLSNHGCPKCGSLSSIKTRTKSLEKFIIDANKIHSNKFDYSKFIYQNAHIYGIIICSKHGNFETSPNQHLSRKSGCPNCAKEAQFSSLEEFLEKAQFIHQNKYNYSKFIYYSTNHPSIIICSKHGEFLQSPNIHLNGKSGCPRCLCKNETLTELYLSQLLPNISISIKPRIKLPTRYLVPDFILNLPNNNKIIIEYNGRQHYEPVDFGSLNESKTLEKFNKQLIRDQLLREYCQNNKIPLIEIDGRIYYGPNIKSYLHSQLHHLIQ